MKSHDARQWISWLNSIVDHHKYMYSLLLARDFDSHAANVNKSFQHTCVLCFVTVCYTLYTICIQIYIDIVIMLSSSWWKFTFRFRCRFCCCYFGGGGVLHIVFYCSINFCISKSICVIPKFKYTPKFEIDFSNMP